MVFDPASRKTVACQELVEAFARVSLPSFLIYSSIYPYSITALILYPILLLFSYIFLLFTIALLDFPSVAKAVTSSGLHSWKGQAGAVMTRRGWCACS